MIRSRCNFDFDGDRRGIDMLEARRWSRLKQELRHFFVRSGILDVKVDHGESIVTRRSTIASVINVREMPQWVIRGGFAFALKAGEGYAVGGSRFPHDPGGNAGRIGVERGAGLFCRTEPSRT